MHIEKVFDNSLLNYSTTFAEVYDTVIAKNGFAEKRNAKIQNGYLQVEVDASSRLKTDAEMLNNFYRECKGRLNTFNFKHPFNFSTNSVASPTPFDVYIGNYTSKPEKIQFKQSTGKKIQIIKYGTIFVSMIDIDESNVNGKILYIDDYENRHVEVSQAFPDFNIFNIENTQGIDGVDYNSGTVTFNDSFVNPNFEYGIYTGCEFYYKMRFDTDNLTFSHDGFDAVSSTFFLVEVTK